MVSCRIWVPCAACVTLNACGSVAGGDLADGGVAIEAGAYHALATRVFVAPEAQPSDLPPDTANMTGQIRLDVNSPSIGGSILGEMDINADFANEQIDGTTSNMGEYALVGCLGNSPSCEMEQLQELEGQLTFSGTISGATYDGSIDGQLTGQLNQGDGTIPLTVAFDIPSVPGNFRIDEAGLTTYANFVSTPGNAVVTTGEGPSLSVDAFNTVTGGFAAAD